jgi:hypothetical protein
MTDRQNPGDGTFIRVSILENSIEAEVIGDALRQEGIPHEVRSYHDTAYDGLFQAQMGWGELRAPAAFREQIHELLDAFRREGPSGPGTPAV